MIYFDNAATSYPKPEILYQEIGHRMKKYGANPGRAGHEFGLRTNRAIYETRESLNQIFNGINPLHFIFTANATESINLVILGLLKDGDHVIATETEHNSVLRPLELAKTRGVRVSYVSVDDSGWIDPKDIEKEICPQTKLVVCTHASNVTGAIQPIEEVAVITKARGVLFMVDAAQSAGIIPIDLATTKIDFLAITGHKSLYGPQGIGALYVRDPKSLPVIKTGGTGSRSSELIQPDVMPDRFESGTLNTPGILGLQMGLDFVQSRGQDKLYIQEYELVQVLMKGLDKIPGVEIYGPAIGQPRVPVVSFNIGDLDSAEISYVLDDKFEIVTRGGLHCAPLIHKRMGTLGQGALRVSIGAFNVREEIDRLLEGILAIQKMT
ncbi:aminotransferase class V-fold PLP-dependent enzyme [Gottschalkiaceae bacterium SANA]|nr:aminotransferase class V-fold PLP-dependent enzyme [Gottschalkiaceae bacterium SANA]